MNILFLSSQTRSIAWPYERKLFALPDEHGGVKVEQFNCFALIPVPGRNVQDAQLVIGVMSSPAFTLQHEQIVVSFDVRADRVHSAPELFQRAVHSIPAREGIWENWLDYEPARTIVSAPLLDFLQRRVREARA